MPRLALTPAAVLAATISALAPQASTPTPPAPVPPLPEPRQLAWHDLERCAFVHFGPNTFTGNEWGKGSEDPAIFNPAALDCRQWCRVFKDAGFKGVILTAKHHDGFCLWPSATTQHTVARSPWRNGRGDVLRELSDACRDAGLRFGVYLSPWDRNHPLYGSGEPYNEVFRAQLREVLTGYGDVFEVWFDGACGEGPDGRRQVYDFPSFERTVRELMPKAVIFSDVGPDIRWVGNEEGHAGETCWGMLRTAGHGRGADNPPSPKSLHQGDLDGDRWIPAECDVSIRPGWFWRESENDKVKSVDQLVDLFERSVGRGAGLLLNVPPDTRGLIHEIDAERLRQMRERLDATYDVDLAQGCAVTADNVRGAGRDANRAEVSPFAASNCTDGDPGTVWATDDEVRRSMLTVTLSRRGRQAVEFDRIVLAEPIAYGQRVGRFTIEARVQGEWREIGGGTTIGHRRIVRTPRVTADAIRVFVEESRAAPMLSRIGVYRTDAGE